MKPKQFSSAVRLGIKKAYIFYKYRLFLVLAEWTSVKMKRKPI
jgi:hypothetical protein